MGLDIMLYIRTTSYGAPVSYRGVKVTGVQFKRAVVSQISHIKVKNLGVQHLHVQVVHSGTCRA